MGLIGSIFQGIFGSNAANKAATVQANASDHAADLEKQSADEALAFNKQQYGNTLSMLSPYYNMGTSSLGRLGFLMGLNPTQGMPAGVVNPNANPTSAGGGLPGNPTPNTRGIQPQTGAPVNRLAQFPSEDSGAMGMFNPQSAQNPFQNNPTLPGAPSNTTQLQMRPPITSPGTATGTQGQINPPITSPGAGGPYQIQTRPPITSGGAAGQAGAAGMLQIGPDGKPTGVTPDFNPGPETLNFNPQSVTNATTNQGGTGQVPQTGGGGLPPGAVTDPDGTVGLGDPSPFGQGQDNLNSGQGSGGFGSLAQNFGEQWKAPTGVTEVNDPGYQFRINQGLQAFQNSAAARGKLVSGDTAKGLNDYAQNSASGEFQNVYNRSLNDYTTRYNAFNQDQNTLFNRFAALSGLGQTAAGQLANVGLGTAGNVSDTLLKSAGVIGTDVQNAGDARASGYIGSQKAINSAINSGSSNIAQLLAMIGGG